MLQQGEYVVGQHIGISIGTETAVSESLLESGQRLRWQTLFVTPVHTYPQDA